MRFHEYESVPSRRPHEHQEYRLTSEKENTSIISSVGSNVGQTRLIWSTHNTSSTSTSDGNELSTNSSERGIIKVVQRKIIHVSTKLRQLCQDLFLPIGYPNSVAEGYLEYQFYDSLQGLCSYLRGVVSTSAVLSATGVGNAEATAMSAAMTWAVRDGLGMIGGLLFSYVASPHFDAHVKEFRLLADVLNDVGLTLDMALPLVLTWISSTSSISSSLPMFLGSWYSIISVYLPSPYLVLTSTSTLCKVACGMAAGATKGNITDHFAISGNRADCQSKESTQETLVSLIGMCCGVYLAKVLHSLEKSGEESEGRDACINDGKDTSNDGSLTDATCTSNNNMFDAQLISWSIFIILTLIHVWANYVGMQMLRLRTLNRERAKVAMQSLVEDCGTWVLDINDSQNDKKYKDMQKTTAPESQMRVSIDNFTGKLLNPKSVSESLWKSMCGMVSPGNIQLGISLKDLVRRTSLSKHEGEWSHGHWNSEKYCIFVDGRGNVIVMLRVGASDSDELKAFLHAHITDWCIQHDKGNLSMKLCSLLSRSYEVTKCLFMESGIDPCSTQNENGDLYTNLGKQGWDTTRLYLGFGPWRCEWNADKDD